MQEDGGLRHLCLLQFLGRAVKHRVGDVEAENLVGLVQQHLRFRIVFVNIFGHSGKLCPLAGEDVGGHVVRGK